jgi:hypothetical protein
VQLVPSLGTVHDSAVPVLVVPEALNVSDPGAVAHEDAVVVTLTVLLVVLPIESVATT